MLPVLVVIIEPPRLMLCRWRWSNATSYAVKKHDDSTEAQHSVSLRAIIVRLMLAGLLLLSAMGTAASLLASYQNYPGTDAMARCVGCGLLKYGVCRCGYAVPCLPTAGCTS